MANQILYSATIVPANAAMEVSTNGGTSFAALAFTTVGSVQQGTLTGVAAATYAAGLLILRAVGYPATALSNPSAVIVAAAAAAFTRQFISDGDSLEGLPGTDPTDFYAPLRWTIELKNLLPTSYGDFRNFGVSGQGLVNMLNSYQTKVLPLRDAATYPTAQYLFVGGGVNDILFGPSPAAVVDGTTAYNRRIQYLNTAITNGFKVLTSTLTGAYGGALTRAAARVQIDSFNSQIRAFAAANAANVCLLDFGADVQIDNTEDVIFRHDNIHFIQAGVQRKALVALNAITAFVAGTATPVGAAPTLAYDATAGTLTVTSPYAVAALLLSTDDGIYQPLPGKVITIPAGSTFAAGKYKVAAKTTSAYNNSPVASSPAIAPAAAAPTQDLLFEETTTNYSNKAAWSAPVSNGVESGFALYTTTVGVNSVFSHPNCSRLRYQCGRLSGFHLYFQWRVDGGAWNIVDRPAGVQEVFSVDYKFDTGPLPMGAHTVEISNLGFAYLDLMTVTVPV